jgi:cobalt-precorrin-7 (C5)-methyltransferase
MVAVIGIGPGDIKHLTLYAVEKIKDSSKVFAFERAARTALEFNCNVKVIKRVDEVTDYIVDGENISILASGDPCFYGILEYLKNKGIAVDEVIPGISSFQYMMAKIKESWQDASLISLHGREENMERVKNQRLSVILTDRDNNPDKISRDLFKLGVRGRIYAGYNLSYEDELILCRNIGDSFENISSLAVVIVENEMD